MAGEALLGKAGGGHFSAIAGWLRREASLFKSDAGKSSAGFPKTLSACDR
jgi:hypothetical protein